MRWLLICLFVSVAALLLAAAGMARHIWLRRSGAPSGRTPGLGLLPSSAPAEAIDVAPETDMEHEL
jgi:hypothetical protein